MHLPVLLAFKSEVNHAQAQRCHKSRWKIKKEITKLISPDLTYQRQLLFDSNNWCLFSTVINPPPRSSVLTKNSMLSNIMFQDCMKEATEFIKYHNYFHSKGFPWTYSSHQFVFFRENTLYNWWFIQKCRLCNTGLWGRSVLLGLPMWWGYSGGLVCIDCRAAFRVGKP